MLPGSRSSDVSEISIHINTYCSWKSHIQWDVNRFEPLMRLMRLSDGSSSVFLMVHKRRIPRFRLQVILWLDSNLARKHERIRKTSTSHNWHNFTAVCTALTALTSRKLYGYRRHENHETTELKVPKLGPTWGSLVSWSKKSPIWIQTLTTTFSNAYQQPGHHGARVVPHCHVAWSTSCISLDLVGSAPQ